MSYIDTKDIGVFDVRAGEADEMIQRGNAVVAGGLLVGICNNGNFSYQVNQAHHNAVRNSVFFALPGQLFSVLDYSNDLEVSVVFVDAEYLLKMGSQNEMLVTQDGGADKTSVPLSLGDIAEVLTGDIVLSDETCADLRSLLSVMRRHSFPQKEESNLRLAVPLIQTVLLVIIEELARSPLKVRTLSRQEQLSKDFFVLLLQHHKEEHDVSYYAGQLFVTPKYLSTVVSKTTGSPVQEWISRLLLYTAKHLLKSGRLSIQQISDELHFSTPSSFIRFFHRLTGVTPREYRVKM